MGLRCLNKTYEIIDVPILPDIKEVFNFSHHHVTCLAQLGPTSKTGGLRFLFKNYFF